MMTQVKTPSPEWLKETRRKANSGIFYDGHVIRKLFARITALERERDEARTVHDAWMSRLSELTGHTQLTHVVAFIESAVQWRERHDSWDGMLRLLDEHWPEDVFGPHKGVDYTDMNEKRDDGPRIVSLIRIVNRLREAHRAGMLEAAGMVRKRDYHRMADIIEQAAEGKRDDREGGAG